MARMVRYDRQTRTLHVVRHDLMTTDGFCGMLQPFKSCERIEFDCAIRLDDYVFTAAYIDESKLSEVVFNAKTDVTEASFMGSRIAHFTFNNDEVTLSESMFADNDALVTITFNASSVIPNYMFAYCSKLEKVIGRLTWIGHHAFFECPRLTYVSHDSATYIGPYAFCRSNLRTIRIRSRRTVIIGTHAFFESAVSRVDLECCPVMRGSHHFSNSDVKRVNITLYFDEEYALRDNVQLLHGMLSKYCFANCAMLTDVDLEKPQPAPEQQVDFTQGLEEERWHINLPEGAFQNCTRLERLSSGGAWYRIKSIGLRALQNCPNVFIQPLVWCSRVQAYACAGTMCDTGFSAAYKLEYIDTRAFFQSKLGMMKLSRPIKYVADHAFEQATIVHLFIAMSALSSVSPDEAPMNPNDGVFKQAKITHLYIEPFMKLGDIDILISNLEGAAYITNIHCTPAFRSRWRGDRGTINWILYDVNTANEVHMNALQRGRVYIPNINFHVPVDNLDGRTQDEIEHERDVWMRVVDWNRNDIPVLEYAPRSP